MAGPIDVMPPPASQMLQYLRKSSDLRKKTFATYKCEEDSLVKEIANKGFIYAGNDRIQCTYCGGIFRQINDIQRKHDRHFPKCPTIDKVVSDGVEDGFSTIDGCGIGNLVLDGTNHVMVINNKKEVFDKDVFHKYKDYDDRLASFDVENWPENFHMKPEDLASAGLYYSGKDDLCICYYCGGKLDEWEENDDPQKEHDRHFTDICDLCDVQRE